MLQLDCPHCYTRVVPMSDGRCPACKQDPRRAGDGDPSLVLHWIARDQQLPSICIACGGAAVEWRKVVRKYAPDRESLIVRLLLPIHAKLMAWGTTNVVALTLPTCRDCSRSPHWNPIAVDFQNQQMSFLVHKRFRDALES